MPGLLSRTAYLSSKRVTVKLWSACYATYSHSIPLAVSLLGINFGYERNGVWGGGEVGVCVSSECRSDAKKDLEVGMVCSRARIVRYTDMTTALEQFTEWVVNHTFCSCIYAA